MGCLFERAQLHVRVPFSSGQVIDINILNAAKNAVKAGQAVASMVVVPGLPIALDALNAILEKAEKAQSNKEGLEALCIEIRKTSEGITALLETLRPKLDRYPADGSVRMALQNATRKEYGDLPTRISLFENQLKGVATRADVLIGRSWWRRWLSASEDATIVADMQNEIAQAYQKFQFEGAIGIEKMLHLVVDQIIEAESKQVLDQLAPGPNPSFRAKSNARKSKFLAGTRMGIFNLLDEWVTDVPGKLHRKHVIILEGGGGMGKSTIASEFCRRLQDRGQLGASFFFTRGTPDLECAAAVIPSVAKQLAEASEIVRPVITTAAHQHLKYGGQQQQVEYAYAELLEPLRCVESPSPIYIVIDALDECREDPQVPALTELCRSLLSFVTKSTSFRLFLTTRPIPDNRLRDAIRSFSDHLHTISLHDNVATDSVDQDIAKLIRDVFSTNIKAQEWCNADASIIPRLVKRADGLFVYARTATTFLTTESGGSFDEALELLLYSPDAPHARLNDLDKLYSTVLTTTFPPQQQLPPKKRVRSILACLIVGHLYIPGLHDKLVGIPPEQAIPILDKLRPVLIVEDEDVLVKNMRLTIMHDTFREFVTSDKSRAGDDFHISIAEAHAVLAMGCMEVLCAAVEPEGEAWAMDSWDWRRLLVARYALRSWAEHVSRSRDGQVVSEERDALAEKVDCFIGTEYQRKAFDERLREHYLRDS